MVNDLKYSPAKIRIIHNGVDPDGFQWTDDRSAVSDLGIGESDKVVGILAMLRPEKDHATFLRAARLVVDRVPDAKFLIVGDGPMRRPRSKGLSANSVFTTAWCWRGPARMSRSFSGQ